MPRPEVIEKHVGVAAAPAAAPTEDEKVEDEEVEVSPKETAETGKRPPMLKRRPMQKRASMLKRPPMVKRRPIVKRVRPNRDPDDRGVRAPLVWVERGGAVGGSRFFFVD